MNLDARLAAAAAALERALDPPAHIDQLDQRQRTRRRRHAAITAIAVVAVVLTSTLIINGRSSSTSHVTASAPPTVQVTHETVTFTETGSLACPNGTASPHPGPFDTMTYETWADETNRVWRTQVRYPDGTTRDVIAQGSPWYPTTRHIRGATRGEVLGCADPGIGILLAEPGQSDIFTLNPLDTIPTIAGPFDQPVPAVQTYSTLGQQVPGDHHDSQGRPAQLWQQIVTGFTGTNNTSAGTDRRITQTTQWYVDAATGNVLEQTYQNDVEGIGTVHSVATLTTHDTQQVPQSTFDPTGYDTEGGTPPPPAN